ncbi:DUF2232 domain-containing protein [Thermodesulfobacteriota bacterium]
MKTSNIIGCAGSVILLLLVSAWLPFIGPFFSLLIPLPFLFYTSKLGLNQGLITGLITLFIVGLIGRLASYPPQLLLFCLEFAVVGLIISEIFRREFSFGLTIFWGTVLMLLVGAVFLFFIGLSKGLGPAELILGYFKSNLNRSISFYEGMGLEPEKVIQIRQFGTMLTELIAKIYPALLVVGTGFVIWINVVISRPLFRLGKIKYPDLGQTDRWKAPEYMVWAVIAAGFSLFFPVSGIQIIAKNILIVLSVIYVFHGLSIIMFFFNRYKIPSWARCGIYVLIIVQQMFLLVLAFAGLFDQWVDFRKIHRKEAS